MSERFIAHHRASDQAQQSLRDHLLGVASLAGQNASKIGLAEAGELIGLVHDLGKYSAAFQSYLKSAVGLIDQDEDEYVDAGALKGKVDHSTAGAQLIWKELLGKNKFGPLAGQILSLCVASHHSGLIDCIGATGNGFGEDLFHRRMGKDRSKSHIDEVTAEADPEIMKRFASVCDNEMLTASIATVVRKILETNRGLPTCGSNQMGLLVRFLFSCLIDADRTDTANFEKVPVEGMRQKGKYERWESLVLRLENHLLGMSKSRPIDSLRREISGDCLEASKREKGIYTLSVPTGGGKTLASLRYALHHANLHQLDRIVYLIPFTSIIDQNAEAVRKVLEPEDVEQGSVVLEHHSNLTPERQTWREKVLSENWDAPVVFTTMVQFLESLFGGGTRGARRMHQLANSVLIFDEIQTLPVRCVHLFNNAVNFLVEQCGSSVVLCTATQPLLHTVDKGKGGLRLSPNHELMPDRKRLFDDLKRVEVVDRRKGEGFTYEEICQLALREMKREGSCLVVVNTKEAARSIFEYATELAPDERIHLSTSMCPAHRKVELAKIRRRLDCGAPTLCVSTQLIEAGVDIDFRVVIRSLAGLDSIAQAAGRCNRNGSPEKGILHLVKAREEKLGRLPEIIKASEASERVLDDFREDSGKFGGDLFGPKALEDFYIYYFHERKKEMAYPLNAKAREREESVLNLLSDNSYAFQECYRRTGNAVGLHFKQAFETAGDAFQSIDSSAIGVIVPYGEEGKELVGLLCAACEVQMQYKLLRRAQQFTVNVFPHVFKKLNEQKAIHQIQKDVEIFHVDTRYYSQQFGLTDYESAEMEILSV
ncbi:MAG: CRISPR-associated helicase Cas3' [Verrucomicrobia bacterium]|nr:CRISPR-associated helicase Cas3' [Verrucomicrobiota bacterium]